MFDGVDPDTRTMVEQAIEGLTIKYAVFLTNPKDAGRNCFYPARSF